MLTVAVGYVTGRDSFFWWELRLSWFKVQGIQMYNLFMRKK